MKPKNKGNTKEIIMVSPRFCSIQRVRFCIMWYGLLIGFGFMLAVLITYFRAPKYNIDPDFILTLTIWIIPSAIIGARLYYVIFSWDDFSGDLSKIFDIRSGGLAIHGGLIMCFIVGYFVCRHYKVKFLDAADLICACYTIGPSYRKMGQFLQRRSSRRPDRPSVGSNHRWCGLSSHIPV